MLAKFRNSLFFGIDLSSKHSEFLFALAPGCFLDPLILGQPPNYNSKLQNCSDKIGQQVLCFSPFGFCPCFLQPLRIFIHFHYQFARRNVDICRIVKNRVLDLSDSLANPEPALTDH